MISANKGQSGYRLSRNVSECIPVRCVFEDGILQTSDYSFSASFSFSDINYIPEGMDERKRKFMLYENFLNSLDSGLSYKISIVTSKPESGRRLYEKREDTLDNIRDEYNLLISKSGGECGIYKKDKFVTVSCAEDSYGAAKAAFERAYMNLSSHFSNLGSHCERLNLDERLKLLQRLYRGDTDAYTFDLRSAARFGADFKDSVCPDFMERRSDFIRMGDRYARVLFIKDYASYLNDSFIAELTSVEAESVLSIDIVPVSTAEAVRQIEKKLLSVETNITNWTRRQTRNKNFTSVIPYDMELQRTEAKEYLNDLKSRDQRMMLGLVTMCVFAKSEDELDKRTDEIVSVSRKHMCQTAVLKYLQGDALSTCFPIGVRQIRTLRTLTTESLAVFMPFKVQEIEEKGGIYIGANAVSGNPLIIKRENLVNQSAIILGVPGSGKSMCAKNMILQEIISTNDDILICDPEGEYAAMIREMNMKDASVAEIRVGGKDYINAMDIGKNADESEYAVKGEFITSLIERIDPKGVGPRQKSIIDRCVRMTYSYAAKNGITPALTMLGDCLLEQKESEAKDIALSLEMYTKGSLDIFSRESNVDLNSRITVFDIHALGPQLKGAGLIVITDAILGRVNRNFIKGRRTHVFLDEFHVLFENEFSASFFTSAWRQFRKRNAYPTAITQNVEYLLSTVGGTTMVSNSDFIVMLSQSYSDREKLKTLLHISDEQMEYVKDSHPGSGLIKYGNYVVPFDAKIGSDTSIYTLMSTRPGEGVFNQSR